MTAGNKAILTERKYFGFIVEEKELVWKSLTDCIL